MHVMYEILRYVSMKLCGVHTLTDEVHLIPCPNGSYQEINGRLVLTDNLQQKMQG